MNKQVVLDYDSLPVSPGAPSHHNLHPTATGASNRIRILYRASAVLCRARNLRTYLELQLDLLFTYEDGTVEGHGHLTRQAGPTFGILA